MDTLYLVFKDRFPKIVFWIALQDVLNSPQANGDFNRRNLLCQATTQVRKMLFFPNKKAAFLSATSQRKAALIRAFQNS